MRLYGILDDRYAQPNNISPQDMEPSRWSGPSASAPANHSDAWQDAAPGVHFRGQLRSRKNIYGLFDRKSIDVPGSRQLGLWHLSELQSH